MSPLCECGCGQPTKRYNQTSLKRGIVKGEFARFLHGHNREARKETTEDLFWEKVDRRGDNECWPWTGATRGVGHGVFWFGGRNGVASRYAYQLAYGPIEDNELVLHHCDNPPCCNTRHLFLGDQAANMRDMVAKGRSLRGERHSLAKLTQAQVVEIRHRRQAGEKLRSLAEAFSVTEANISYVARGKTWA